MKKKNKINKTKLLLLNWIPPTIICFFIFILEFLFPVIFLRGNLNSAISSPIFTNSISLIFIVGVSLSIIITIFYDSLPGITIKRKKWTIFLFYLLLFYLLSAISLIFFNDVSPMKSFPLAIIFIPIILIPSAFWSHIFLVTRSKLGGEDNIDIRNIKDYEVQGIATKVNKDEVLRKAYIVPMRSLKIIRFRIEKIDEQGNVIKIIPVELRGKDFIGEISEGDEVKVIGKMENGTVLAKEIINITTNARLQTKLLIQGEILPIILKWIIIISIIIIAIILLMNSTIWIN